jgi:predicted nucleotidyltransferase
MSKQEIFKKIKKEQQALINLGVHRIGLFGSHVRGDSTSESDIDFLVDFAEGKKSFDNFIELCFLLEELFGKNIDVLTVESLSPHLKNNILSEAQYEVIN